jgi:hypothetical protein
MTSRISDVAKVVECWIAQCNIETRVSNSKRARRFPVWTTLYTVGASSYSDSHLEEGINARTLAWRSFESLPILPVPPKIIMSGKLELVETSEVPVGWFSTRYELWPSYSGGTDGSRKTVTGPSPLEQVIESGVCLILRKYDTRTPMVIIQGESTVRRTWDRGRVQAIAMDRGQ